MMKRYLLAGLYVMLAACSHYPAMKTVDHVDIDRFMGQWFVIANIPTFIEEGAHNAIESYEKNPDGSIATRFSFSDGSFDGEQKVYHPTGFIQDTSTNATWGMQFIWPFKADYRIIYLDDNYSITVIGRQARDYLWIMARKPEISHDKYTAIIDFIKTQGYDTTLIQRVPQCWPHIMQTCSSNGGTQ
jgi:apolipoprotein D and lipocalin family protein